MFVDNATGRKKDPGCEQGILKDQGQEGSNTFHKRKHLACLVFIGP